MYNNITFEKKIIFYLEISNLVLSSLFKTSNMTETKAKSYMLRTENGGWLAQIVLTEDGMFASVTDWGNLSYAWRSFGDTDFREFISNLNTGYFATKLTTGLSYIIYDRKIAKQCNLFAEKILPPLQKVLKEELQNNIGW